jgi:hypothetical protein
MYFFIACNEEPPRSFKLLIAVPTISDVGGCTGFVRGFFADDFAFFGVACEGFAAAGAESKLSAITTNFDHELCEIMSRPLNICLTMR